MKMVDLYCGAGGCAKGYHDAGFDEIIGVDIVDRPTYPYTFVKMDALEFIKSYDWSDVDFVHASPPCQFYTKLKYLSGDVNKWEENHVDLVAPTRELISELGIPYVIENVAGAPLHNPLKLFGSQFKNIYTQRERWFESNIHLNEPTNPPTKHKTPKLGFGFGEDGFITVAGTKPPMGMNEVQTKLYYGFALGGIDWMTLKELTQAIPPVYTEFIGRQIINYIKIKNKHNGNNEQEQNLNSNPMMDSFDMDEFVKLVMKYMQS